MEGTSFVAGGLYIRSVMGNLRQKEDNNSSLSSTGKKILSMCHPNVASFTFVDD